MTTRLLGMLAWLACVPVLPAHASGVADAAAALVSLHPRTARLPETKIRAKARVWVFLSAQCPCSNSHISKLKQTAAEFDAQGVEFVGVNSNQDEPEAVARAYFENADIGFAVFRDPGARVADRLGALKTPHVFIEGTDGRILYDGGIDDTVRGHSTEKNYLRDALLEILAAKPVSRPRSRSLGCVISRGEQS